MRELWHESGKWRREKELTECSGRRYRELCVKSVYSVKPAVYTVTVYSRDTSELSELQRLPWQLITVIFLPFFALASPATGHWGACPCFPRVHFQLFNLSGLFRAARTLYYNITFYFMGTHWPIVLSLFLLHYFHMSALNYFFVDSCHFSHQILATRLPISLYKFHLCYRFIVKSSFVWKYTVYMSTEL